MISLDDDPLYLISHMHTTYLSLYMLYESYAFMPNLN